jgi:hypothetical protein
MESLAQPRQRREAGGNRDDQTTERVTIVRFAVSSPTRVRLFAAQMALDLARRSARRGRGAGLRLYAGDRRAAMRLFIAADLDERARAAVSGAAERFRALSEGAHRGSTRGVSWVDARNLHLTLHFLGEVDEAGCRAEDALAGVGSLRSRMAGWGVFPPRGPAE